MTKVREKKIPRVRWTLNQLEQATICNISISGVMRDLGLVPSGNSHVIIKREIARCGFDISHWSDKKRASIKGYKGTPFKARYDLDDILIENSPYRNFSYLKTLLIKCGLLENKCYNDSCFINRPEWLGKFITLQLDHINGICNDNRLENLRILCPNCHTQTETWGRKNKGPSIRYEYDYKRKKEIVNE